MKKVKIGDKVLVYRSGGGYSKAEVTDVVEITPEVKATLPTKSPGSANCLTLVTVKFTEEHGWKRCWLDQLKAQ